MALAVKIKVRIDTSKFTDTKIAGFFKVIRSEISPHRVDSFVCDSGIGNIINSAQACD